LAKGAEMFLIRAVVLEDLLLNRGPVLAGGVSSYFGAKIVRLFKGGDNGHSMLISESEREKTLLDQFQ